MARENRALRAEREELRQREHERLARRAARRACENQKLQSYEEDEE